MKRKMSYKQLPVLAICCLLRVGAYADTTSPTLTFSNGASVSINYLNERMNQENRLGFAFDDNPNTVWRLPGSRKSVALVLRSNKVPFSNLKLDISCNSRQRVSLRTDVSGDILPLKSNNYLHAELNQAHYVKIALSGGNICVNDLALSMKDDHQATAFIEETGGGYPTVYLFAQRRWVEHFDPGNVASYFFRNEKFAIFVLNADIGPLGGIKIVNLDNLRTREYLTGELLDFDSIKWQGDTVSGFVVDPNDNWSERGFRINVDFP